MTFQLHEHYKKACNPHEFLYQSIITRHKEVLLITVPCQLKDSDYITMPNLVWNYFRATPQFALMFFLDQKWTWQFYRSLKSPETYSWSQIQNVYTETCMDELTVFPLRCCIGDWFPIYGLHWNRLRVMLPSASSLSTFNYYILITDTLHLHSSLHHFWVCVIYQPLILLHSVVQSISNVLLP